MHAQLQIESYHRASSYLAKIRVVILDFLADVFLHEGLLVSIINRFDICHRTVEAENRTSLVHTTMVSRARIISLRFRLRFGSLVVAEIISTNKTKENSFWRAELS